MSRRKQKRWGVEYMNLKVEWTHTSMGLQSRHNVILPTMVGICNHSLKGIVFQSQSFKTTLNVGLIWSTIKTCICFFCKYWQHRLLCGERTTFFLHSNVSGKGHIFSSLDNCVVKWFHCFAMYGSEREWEAISISQNIFNTPFTSSINRKNTSQRLISGGLQK